MQPVPGPVIGWSPPPEVGAPDLGAAPGLQAAPSMAGTGSETEVEIEKLVPGGAGLARTGRGVVLVRGVLPGERARVRLRRVKNHFQGELLGLIRRSSQRLTIDLPATADLPLEYAAQLPVKQGFVQECLERIAGERFELQPICPSPRPLGYRAVAQWAVQAQGGLAYRVAGSHELRRVDRDALVLPVLDAILGQLSRCLLPDVSEVVVRGSASAGRAVAALFAPTPETVERLAGELLSPELVGVGWAAADPRGRFRGACRHLRGEPWLLEDFGGIAGTVTVSSFAQVNPPAAALLYREAREIAGEGKHAIDLFGGSGILAFHLAERFRAVSVVEINRDAVELGQRDRERLGLSRVRFLRGDAARVRELPPAELIVVDPPRGGIRAETLAAIVGRSPSRLLYVSCDPATWARDVKRLGQAGYRLRFVRPYDFYPCTHHVEVLSLLTR